MGLVDLKRFLSVAWCQAWGKSCVLRVQTWSKRWRGGRKRSTSPNKLSVSGVTNLRMPFSLLKSGNRLERPCGALAKDLDLFFRPRVDVPAGSGPERVRKLLS